MSFLKCHADELNRILTAPLCLCNHFLFKSHTSEKVGTTVEKIILLTHGCFSCLLKPSYKLFLSPQESYGEVLQRVSTELTVMNKVVGIGLFSIKSAAWWQIWREGGRRNKWSTDYILIFTDFNCKLMTKIIIEIKLKLVF